MCIYLFVCLCFLNHYSTKVCNVNSYCRLIEEEQEMEMKCGLVLRNLGPFRLTRGRGSNSCCDWCTASSIT